MRAKLKLAESLTPKEVRELQKLYNNRIIEVDEDAIGKKLQGDYTATKTELREDGFPIFIVHNIADLPEF